MTKIQITDRLSLAWDDFNWLVLRERKRRKEDAKPSFHRRYYARLSQALLALLNEIPKESTGGDDIAALTKSVKDAEARVLEVVARLERTDGPSKKLADCYS